MSYIFYISDYNFFVTMLYRDNNVINNRNTNLIHEKIFKEICYCKITLSAAVQNISKRE